MTTAAVRLRVSRCPITSAPGRAIRACVLTRGRCHTADGRRRGCDTLMRVVYSAACAPPGNHAPTESPWDPRRLHVLETRMESCRHRDVLGSRPRVRSTLPNTPTRRWLESDNPSLEQTQGDSPDTRQTTHDLSRAECSTRLHRYLSPQPKRRAADCRPARPEEFCSRVLIGITDLGVSRIGSDALYLAMARALDALVAV